MKLISVIGEDSSQLIPVIYYYQNITTEHILICNNLHLQKAKRLKSGLQSFIASHQLSWKVTIIEIDADNLAQSVKSFKSNFSNFKDYYINTSLALLILGELLGEIVLKGGGSVINYDINSNKIYLLEPNSYSVTCSKVGSKLTLKALLTLLDYTIVKLHTKEDLFHKKEQILTLYKEPARFKKLRYALLYPDLNRDFNFSFYKELLQILQKLNIVEGSKLIESKRAVLGGTLFEEYIFWLCEALDFDDIAMGVQIDFDSKTQEPNSNNRVYNEFDILLMKENKIYTIECKYSNYLDGLELVYKYDAIIDYFGGSTKAMILNISSKRKKEYLGMKSSKNFSNSTIRRAKHSNIYIYHESVLNPKKFQQKVKEYFNLGVKNEDR